MKTIFYSINKDPSNKTKRAILNEYNQVDLKEKLVFRCEDHDENKLSKMFFTVMDIDSQETIDFINKIGNINHQTWHEICIGNRIQKIVFDIEIYKDELIACDGNETIFLSWIKENLENVFGALYPGIVINREDDFLVFTSSGISGDRDKISYHIIAFPNKYHVSSFEQNKKIANYLIESFKKYPELQKSIDLNIYREKTSLRVFGSSKNGRKKIYKSGQFKNILLDSLFTYIPEGSRILSDIKCTKQLYENVYNECTLENDTLNCILNNEDVKKLIDNKWKFRAIKNNNLVLFSRHAKNTRFYCDICSVKEDKERYHDNDNTFILKIKKTMVGCKTQLIIYRGCMRYPADSILVTMLNHQSMINIEEHLSNSKNKKLTDEEKSNPEIVIKELYKSSYRIFEQNNIENYVKTDIIKTKETIDPFSDLDDLTDFTYFLKAPMKYGKTNYLMNYMKQIMDNDNSSGKIVILSFRRTFTSNMCFRLEKENLQFHNYIDVKDDEITESRIVIQIESLHKLSVQNYQDLDLLILDESESIIEQFSSLLVNCLEDCLENFVSLYNFSKRVICMDANISAKTFNIFDLLNKHITIPKQFISKTYIRELDSNNSPKYTIHIKKNTFETDLITDLSLGYKIAFATNSLKIAKAIKRKVNGEMPNLNVGIYSSETSELVKKEHFSNVNLHMKYDLLIYTPTLTAGVSFEEVYYKKVYGYFSTGSCSIETCIQMLGRIRSLQEYCLYFNQQSASGGFVSNRTLISEYTEEQCIKFDYSKDSIIQNLFKQIKIENQLVSNYTQNYLLLRYMYLVFSDTYKENIDEMINSISFIFDNDSDEEKKKSYINKQIKEIEKEDNEHFINDPLISNEDYGNICFKEKDGELNDVERRLKLKKEICSKYNIDNKYLSHFNRECKTITYLRNPSYIKIYNNLCKFAKCEFDIDKLKNLEDYNLTEFKNNPSSLVEKIKIENKLISDKIYQVNRMAKLLGFNRGVLDMKTIVEEKEMYSNISKTILILEKEIKQISMLFCAEGGLRLYKTNLERTLINISKLFKCLLGITIKKNIDEYGGYIFTSFFSIDFKNYKVNLPRSAI